MPYSRDQLRAMVISAAMCALGLALPPVFHAAGLGSKFLPMLLPLLLNGFLSPPGWAAAVGFAVPLISTLTMGMPPLYPPVAVVMAVEGATLGGMAALLRRRLPLWPSLVVAIVCGRAVMFAGTWLMASALSLPPAVTAGVALLQGLPGVALQLVTVPVAVRVLRARPGLLFNDAARDAGLVRYTDSGQRG
jgi:hypothetical protein